MSLFGALVGVVPASPVAQPRPATHTVLQDLTATVTVRVQAGSAGGSVVEFAIVRIGSIGVFRWRACARARGATLLAGAPTRWQSDIDLGDWTDMPDYSRAVMRPRCNSKTARFAPRFSLADSQKHRGVVARSPVFATTALSLGISQRLTRPYRPQTNGKAERVIRTLLTEWAYAEAFGRSHWGTRALTRYLTFYNTRSAATVPWATPHRLHA